MKHFKDIFEKILLENKDFKYNEDELYKIITSECDSQKM